MISAHARFNASLLAISCALVPLEIAHAQDASGAAPASAPAASSAADVGDDIVVTARRSAEAIQSTPVSVTAFNAESLREAGIRSTPDLMMKTPGVYLGGSGGRENSTFQIRGQSKARQGFNSPAVISYFADVPLPTFGSAVPTFDISSVQVLKGPQGTLFGRNTTGGAILFYPTAPDYDFGGYVQAGYGNYDDKQLEAAVNVPIAQDVAALRVSGYYNKRDGWTRDITHNVDLDNTNVRAFRVSLLLEPMEGVRNVTTYDYYQNRYNGDSVVLTGIRPFAPLLPAALGIRAAAEAALARQKARGPRFVESDSRPFSATRRQGVTNRTDIELGSDISLTNIFGYRRTYLEYLINIDGLPRLASSTIPGASFTVVNGNAHINTEQYTNEVQLKGALFDGKVDWLLGGFYLHSNPFGPNGTGALSFYSGAAPLDMNNFGYNFLTEDSRAVFGNVSIKLDNVVEGLKLGLGARYTWDKAKSCTANDTTTQGNLGPKDCTSGNPAAINPSVNRTKSDAPTWQASLEWQATRDLFLYATTRRGYRSGGLNAPTLQGRLAPFQSFGPEKATDYEIGFRSDWNLGGNVRARLNVSAFLGNYSGTAFSLSGLRTNSVPACLAAGGAIPTSPDGDCDPNNDPISGALVISAGKTRVKGIDVDGFIALGRAFRFNFAGNLLDPESVSIDLPPALAPYLPLGTAIGFDFVAKHTYTLGMEFNQPLADDADLSAGIDLYHSGKVSFTDAKFPAYSVVNARMDFNNISHGRFDIGLWAKNLFNKEYLASGSFNGPAAGVEASIFGAPRQYGVTLRYRFGDR